MLDYQGGGRVLIARHNWKGMTLIEVLVAMAIVFILLAASVPNFKDWIQNSKIRTSAESILNGLSLAKTEAVHRNAVAQFVSCGGSSWDVMVASSVASSSSVCASAAEAGWATVQTQAVQTGSHNLVVPDHFSIGFNGLGRQANATNLLGGSAVAPTNMEINVSTSLDGAKCICPAGTCGYPAGISYAASGKLRCLRITVSSGGQVRMCDPALTAGTPQGC